MRRLSPTLNPSYVISSLLPALDAEPPLFAASLDSSPGNKQQPHATKSRTFCFRELG